MSHSTAPMTIRLPVELKERLDKLAQATERSRSWQVSSLTAEFDAPHCPLFHGA